MAEPPGRAPQQVAAVGGSGRGRTGRLARIAASMQIETTAAYPR